jgi:predicted amino acid-binding ACT domain protein
VLADADANITDFGSRLGADSTFAMWFNVSLADDTNVDDLAESLRRAGGDLQLDVRVYRAEAEEL